MSTTTSNKKLTATIREGRGKGPARQLRMAGAIPAVVYGLGADNQSVSVNSHDLEQILRTVGVNAVVTLVVDGNEQPTLCRQVQRDPVKRSLEHVDFIRVNPNVAVEAEVALQLEGEPEGVRNGGRLEQIIFAVTVEALPDAIPNGITHDISALGLGDQLHVRDLVAPAGSTIATDGDELIAQVSVPRGGVGGAEGGEDEAAATAEASE